MGFRRRTCHGRHLSPGDLGIRDIEFFRGVALKRPAADRVDLSHFAWAFWLAFAALTLSVTRPDPDLWGHLRFGLDWWQSFSLPSADPYSFTQDKPWINHEWLSEALMGAAYGIGGTTGLILLKIAVIGATLGLLRRRLRGATPLVAALVMGLAIMCAMPISLTVRPQLWSLLCLTALATILDDERRPAVQIGLCALLFAFWANLHGGWITGAAVLFVYSFMRILTAPRTAVRWLAVAAAGIAATLINPYGIGLWEFLASTVRASRPDISEWQPMGVESPLILWLPLLSVLLLATLLSRRPETRPSAPVWAVLLVLVGAAVRVHRVAPLMGPASLALLGPCIVKSWGHLGQIRARAREAALVLWIPVAVAVIAVSRPIGESFKCLPIDSDWTPDLEAAASLQARSGRLWTTFDWGEYAIWHFGPALKVSIDGRRETIYSDAVIQLHRRFERGEPDAAAQVQQIGPDYVWLQASKVKAKAWLEENGYRIDVDTGLSFIATRQDLPKLLTATHPMPSCFP